MIRYSDEMKLWLFDLAHGNLEEKDIIAGFIKYYVLFDCTIQDVKRDIIFHTNYGNCGCVSALDSLSIALEHIVSNANEVMA